MRNVIFIGLLAAVLAAGSVSATNCWEIHAYTGGWDTQSFWLCNSSQVVGYWYHSPTEWGPFSMMLHGQIESTAPPGYLYGSGTYRAYLQCFNYASPYPATLKCYKRMGVSWNYWWMYTGQTVTLEDSDSTSMSSAWVLAGCPPIQNTQHQPGSPPQVYISTNWVGFGTKGKRR